VIEVAAPAAWAPRRGSSPATANDAVKAAAIALLKVSHLEVGLASWVVTFTAFVLLLFGGPYRALAPEPTVSGFIAVYCAARARGRECWTS
jgi:hypothetical protein